MKRNLKEIELKNTNYEELKSCLEKVFNYACLESKKSNPYIRLAFVFEDEYCNNPQILGVVDNKSLFGFVGQTSSCWINTKNGHEYISLEELTDRLWNIIQRDYM